MMGNIPVLLITPPFTQLNTPYPATAFLKGFLNTRGIVSHQVDLGLEVILKLFSAPGLTRLFAGIDPGNPKLSGNFKRILALSHEYISTIDRVIAFLQDKDPSVAHLICGRRWLPEASRFAQTADLDAAFGDMGLYDKARHLATLYLEDISDLISGVVDPLFGFSRYAERLGRTPATYDELENRLQQPDGVMDHMLVDALRETMDQTLPAMVAITVPFPGNLFSALKCGGWIKKNRPGVIVTLGGGYISTELRSLEDPRIFDVVDFIILDDGEIPLLNLLEHLDGSRPRICLKRTFAREEGRVLFFDGSSMPDCLPDETGTPDYDGLLLHRYLPVIEMANPMHRLWSDGRWNRLMLAHGCYWAKCSFCDTELDYIRRYAANTPGKICDRMETVMARTGRNGFHFVDEAAPPSLLKELALEILRRDLNVCWWTNIRFEKNFTRDLCILLKASGCIAVSGGLEVASDRILKRINKGITVSQAALVAGHFAHAGILVHTYLMYGFPTQTAGETIDSLEIVRQMFLNGLVQSGFWHLFAMTAHSQVGKHPEQFGVIRAPGKTNPFANNDLSHADPAGCDHETFGIGLHKALYNYMHGICLDLPLQEWFDFPVPQTTIAPGYIGSLKKTENSVQPWSRTDPHGIAPFRVIWLGGPCSVKHHVQKKKGKIRNRTILTLHNRNRDVSVSLPEAEGKWLNDLLPMLSVRNRKVWTLEELKQEYELLGAGDFDRFLKGGVMQQLRENGLILL